MLSRLCLSPSTNHTLLIEIEELPVVLIPMILPYWHPPNPTVIPSFIVRVRNIEFSHVMCRRNHCPGTMISTFPFLLSISATKIISDLGTHIFMGPLCLVLKGLFFLCALRLNLYGLWSFKTLGLKPFGLKSHEATIVFLL